MRVAAVHLRDGPIVAIVVSLTVIGRVSTILGWRASVLPHSRQRHAAAVHKCRARASVWDVWIAGR